ncbi:MAG: hypothetical protein V1754_14065 [Pseudomonadota bacterium]
MDWAVDFVSNVDTENVNLMRETLEAKLKAESGQYGEAARILWELLVQVRHAKKNQWECITMVHLGKVYKALRWKIAMQLFEQALELSETIEFPRAKMMALDEIGEMECNWGHFVEAIELFQKSLSLVERGDLESKRSILLNMIIAYEGLDDLQRCRTFLEEVLQIDETIDSAEMDEDKSHLERIKATIAH